MTAVNVGQEVGARRWPFSTGHLGNWGAPWKGLVLDPSDPAAWANTGAFPTSDPDPEQVQQHLARVGDTGRVPVQWDFGGSKVVYWERRSTLRPYADDLAAWETARQLEMMKCSIPSDAAQAA